MSLRKDLLLVGLLVAILMLMIIPLDQMVIDLLLSVNITLAVVLLTVAIYLKQPSDFSTFPSVILIGTAFRLALSIGTTRLILSEADGGAIIETFGNFVVQGSVAIGLVIFLIITVVQFLVVTKGAERVAEVGARFALDALPGKQMSIDADIRAGTLDPEVGEQMRKRLYRDSQFFGSMDGAMKFVKGDAIAGLIIIAINLIGGIAVGVTTHDLSLSEAGAVFSLLTIGDGLVAQVPALLMSLCAGIIVTRATNADNQDLGSDIGKELITEPRVPAVAAVVVLGIGLVPGFPIVMFGSAAAVLLVLSILTAAKLKRDNAVPVDDIDATNAPSLPDDLPAPTPMLEISNRLVLRLGSDLADRVNITAICDRAERQFLALNARSGVNFQRPDVVVSPDLDPDSFALELDEVPVLRDNIPAYTRLFRLTADKAATLAQCDVDTLRPIDWHAFNGVAVSEIEAGNTLATATADDPAIGEITLGTALGDQLFGMHQRYIGNLFSRPQFDDLIDRCRTVDEIAIESAITKTGSAALFATFRHLVEEGVPLRPLNLLLSGLQAWVDEKGVVEPEALADGIRLSMRRQMCHAAVGDDGILGLVMVGPELERALRKRISGRRADTSIQENDLNLPEGTLESVLADLHNLIRDGGSRSKHVAVVISSDLRRRFRRILAVNNIDLMVFAPHEIAQDVRSFPLSVLGAPQ